MSNNQESSRYVDFDPFGGEMDVDVRYRTVKMVITRSVHECFGRDDEGFRLHKIPAGTRCRYEKALVDGEWGQWYCCIPCMEHYISSEETTA